MFRKNFKFIILFSYLKIYFQIFKKVYSIIINFLKNIQKLIIEY